MVKPFVYYYPLDLSKPEQGRMRDSLKRLERLLAEPPVERHCSIGRLPSNAEKGVLAALRKTDLDIPSISASVAEEMANTGPIPGLVVNCSTDHPLAKTCLTADPDACWGLRNGGLAVVYDDGDPALWHEVLHLLGADDCYDLPDRGPTCKPRHPQCIMQYEPKVCEVQGKLPICRKNVELIQCELGRITD